MNMGVVDIYRLAIHPVIIGEGILLFKDIRKRIGLELTEIKQSNSGAILLNYSLK